jgi:hypothetical protein
MIEIRTFIDAYRSYQKGRCPYRLLQDQAAVLIGICRNTYRPIAGSLEVTDADIDWLLRQPEASGDYADVLGGNVDICETADDLKQIVGMDLDWASTHGNQWPNVTDLPMAWDSCTYLAEKAGNPEWAMFLLCWNDAGGPVYYVPKCLWQAARVEEHMAATTTVWNP